MKFTLHGFLFDLLFFVAALVLACLVGCPNQGQQEVLPEAVQQPQQEIQTHFSSYRFNKCLLCLPSKSSDRIYCIPTRRIRELMCEGDSTRIKYDGENYIIVSKTCSEIISLWNQCY